MNFNLDEYSKSITDNFNGLLNELAEKQKELLKELTPEEKKSYNRTVKRAQDMAKKKDFNGLNNLKKKFNNE